MTAATNAAMAMMTTPTGLAVSAALSAHCATVQMLEAMATAFWATAVAIIAAVSRMVAPLERTVAAVFFTAAAVDTTNALISAHLARVKALTATVAVLNICPSVAKPATACPPRAMKVR